MRRFEITYNGVSYLYMENELKRKYPRLYWQICEKSYYAGEIFTIGEKITILVVIMPQYSI